MSPIKGHDNITDMRVVIKDHYSSKVIPLFYHTKLLDITFRIDTLIMRTIICEL